jgi:hypothetical protein
VRLRQVETFRAFMPVFDIFDMDLYGTVAPTQIGL